MDVVEFSEYPHQPDNDRQTSPTETQAGERTVQGGGAPEEGFVAAGEEGKAQPSGAPEGSPEKVEETPRDVPEGPAGSPETSLEAPEKVEEDELTLIKEQLALKEEEARSYYDRLLRLQAEFENFRKRMAKEKAEFTKYANEELVKNLLPVLDNLERALASAEQQKDFEGLSKGVEMIFKQLYEILKKAGLTDIEALHQPFDPVVHQAVARTESSEVENNTIIEVLQKGYYFHDRVLRPAMVKVVTQSS